MIPYGSNKKVKKNEETKRTIRQCSKRKKERQAVKVLMTREIGAYFSEMEN